MSKPDHTPSAARMGDEAWDDRSPVAQAGRRYMRDPVSPAATTRAQPPPDPVHESEPPIGFHEEWREEPGRRRAATAEEREQRKCRRPGCRRTPVMALQRSNGWWLYCDWHTYGSRVTEDGRVVSRYIVPDEDDRG